MLRRIAFVALLAGLACAAGACSSTAQAAPATYAQDAIVLTGDVAAPVIEQLVVDVRALEAAAIVVKPDTARDAPAPLARASSRELRSVRTLVARADAVSTPAAA